MTSREQLIQTISVEATEWRRELHRNPQTMYVETFASYFAELPERRLPID